LGEHPVKRARAFCFLLLVVFLGRPDWTHLVLIFSCGSLLMLALPIACFFFVFVVARTRSQVRLH
jgi:hypothetical protein